MNTALFASVAWHETHRDGDYVHMKRGSGYETGWWHEHHDGTDYCAHPMDYTSKTKMYVCRDCGEKMSPNA